MIIGWPALGTDREVEEQPHHAGFIAEERARAVPEPLSGVFEHGAIEQEAKRTAALEELAAAETASPAPVDSTRLLSAPVLIVFHMFTADGCNTTKPILALLRIVRGRLSGQVFRADQNRLEPVGLRSAAALQSLCHFGG